MLSTVDKIGELTNKSRVKRIGSEATGETRVASRQNAAAPVACHLKWFSANAYLALGYAAPRSIPIVYLQLISDVHRDWIAQKADRAEPVIAGVHEGGAC